MKLTTVSSAAIALAASTLAQEPATRSAPFSVLVLSADSFYNGTYLSWVRGGPFVYQMAFSNATLGISGINDFYLNSTSGYSGGTLHVDQSISSSNGNFTVPLSFQLDSSLSTNLASTWMRATGKAHSAVNFDDKGLMNLQLGGHDDTQMPDPKLVMSGPRALYRWAACKEFGPYGGVMNTLMWVVGGKPQNPTCVEINLKKV